MWLIQLYSSVHKLVKPLFATEASQEQLKQTYNKKIKPKTKQIPTQPKTKPTYLHLHAHSLTGKYACNRAAISS